MRTYSSQTGYTEDSKTATLLKDPYRIGQVRCLERTCSQFPGSEYSCGKYRRTRRDTVIQAWSVAPPRGRPSPITQSMGTDTQSQRATERKGNFRCHKESGQPATLFGPSKAPMKGALAKLTRLDLAECSRRRLPCGGKVWRSE